MLVWVKINEWDSIESTTHKDQIDTLLISNKKTGKPSSLQGCSILMTKLNKNLNLATTTKNDI